MKILPYLGLFSLLFVFGACDDGCEPIVQDIDLTGIPYNPSAYTLPTPYFFPAMEIPSNNPLTKEGVELGRRLFYDPILSADSTQSCSSCHFQEHAFSDVSALSVGIDGNVGTRNSMALINLGYNTNGFFWDGRATSLEQQALEPVENPVEMHDTWENVETKLRRDTTYQDYFRQAFGISYASEINKDLATKALSQFMRTLISYRSKFDKARGVAPYVGIRPVLTDAEERGRLLFARSDDGFGDPQCSHCHNTELFTNNSYRNNGLEGVTDVNDFLDLGLGGITGINGDKGKFRIPTLRNIELTAPYMHDGRFASLEEVLDHYNEHFQNSPTLDANLGVKLSTGLGLSAQDKADIISFLKTLTDTDFTNDPAFSNPFK